MTKARLSVQQKRNGKPAAIAAIVTLVLTVALISGIVLRAGEDPSGPGPSFSSLAITALVTILLAFALPTAFTGVRVRTTKWWPWVVGSASLSLSLAAWALVWLAPSVGASVYRALRVPQGPVTFWDMRLTLETVDCAAWGFDVYQENNGCLADPSIYGPGITWWQFVRALFTEPNTTALGLLLIVTLSLTLVWIARLSMGLAAVILFVAAIGAPWQLLLERGNIDAIVLVVAVASVWLTRRWNTYWAWSLAATAVWLAGTWKYYPFVLGVLLIPALKLRHGWIVLSSFVVATVVFFWSTWTNVLFSLDASSGMAVYGDFVVLGRIPVVARLPEAWTFGHLLFGALCVAALTWGVLVARARAPFGNVSRVSPALLLAMGGSLLYLTSVAVTGFAYGYKVAFLVLVVPSLRIRGGMNRIELWSNLVTMALLVIAFVVVWNTVLATIAGVLAACLMLGQETYRFARQHEWSQRPKSRRYQRDHVSSRE